MLILVYRGRVMQQSQKQSLRGLYKKEAPSELSSHANQGVLAGWK